MDGSSPSEDGTRGQVHAAAREPDDWPVVPEPRARLRDHRGRVPPTPRERLRGPEGRTRGPRPDGWGCAPGLPDRPRLDDGRRRIDGRVHRIDAQGPSVVALLQQRPVGTQDQGEGRAGHANARQRTRANPGRTPPDLPRRVPAGTGRGGPPRPRRVADRDPWELPGERRAETRRPARCRREGQDAHLPDGPAPSRRPSGAEQIGPAVLHVPGPGSRRLPEGIPRGPRNVKYRRSDLLSSARTTT